jgi:hypothetical protein
MFNTIKGMKLESPISGIVVSPIIFDGSIAKPPADQVKYMSSEKSVVCCIAIDYSLWTLASLPERLNLLADNVRDAITRIPRRYLCSEDLSKLRAVVDQVQSRLLTHITQSLI